MFRRVRVAENVPTARVKQSIGTRFRGIFGACRARRTFFVCNRGELIARGNEEFATQILSALAVRRPQSTTMSLVQSTMEIERQTVPTFDERKDFPHTGTDRKCADLVRPLREEKTSLLEKVITLELEKNTNINAITGFETALKTFTISQQRMNPNVLRVNAEIASLDNVKTNLWLLYNPCETKDTEY